MRKILAIAAMACSFGITTAKAETMDVSTIKCSDLAKISKEDMSYILIWAAGYEAGKTETPTLDISGMAKWGEAIGKKCGANGDLGLLTAIKQIGEDQ